MSAGVAVMVLCAAAAIGCLGAPRPRPARSGARRSVPGRGGAQGRWWPFGLVILAPVSWWCFGGRVGSVLTALLIVGLAAGWVGRRRIRMTKQRRRCAEVARAGELIASELMLGKIPQLALIAAAEDCPVLGEAAAATRVGASATEVWAQQSQTPGLGNLAVLARAWSVAEVSGAALAPTLSSVASGLRGEVELQREIDGELAASRMTGVVLALLPVAAIVLGYLIGGDPLEFLTANGWGQLCLVAGVFGACAGLVWTERLGVGSTT